MKKVFSKIKTALLAGIVSATMVLSGCGKDQNLWLIHLKDGDVDMSGSFTDILEELIDLDQRPADMYQGGVYEEDGSFSGDYPGYNDNNDDLLYISHYEGDDENVVCLYFNVNYNKAFKKAEFANNITRKTKEEELPDNFLYLDYYYLRIFKHTNESQTYYSIIVDGKEYNLNKYVKKLPDELSEEYYDELVDRYEDLSYVVQQMTVYELMENICSKDYDWIADKYEDEEAIRNAVAITFALSDIYKDFQNGKIENFGTITVTYEEEDMVSVSYFVVNEK